MLDQPLQSFDQQPAEEEKSDSIDLTTPVSASEEGRYFCHRCCEALKHSKDFIRHVEQTCEPVQEWRCPDCPKTYRRVERFKSHHEERHSCGSGRCTHAKAAKQDLPRRAAHGCGFCIQYFESDIRRFLKHLIGHYDQGCKLSDWSVTILVRSMLQRPQVLKMWNEVCAQQSHDPLNPLLSWTQHNSASLLNKLEHDTPDNELRIILIELLHIGLHGHASEPKQSTTIGKTPIGEASLSIDTKCTTGDGWRNIPAIFETLALEAMGQNVLHNKSPLWYDVPEDLSELTPSTLVNPTEPWDMHQTFEDNAASGLWELPAADLLTSGSTPPFGWTSDEANDNMELDNSNFLMPNSETSFNPSYNDTNKSHHASFMEGLIIPSIDTINMHSAHYPGPDSARQSSTLSSPSYEAMPDFSNDTGAWPVNSQSIGHITSEPNPPFNPTPSIDWRKVHRRSVSRSVLRRLQKF